MDNIIETLADDHEYYSGKGREYISNSDIKDILNDPQGHKYRLETGTRSKPTVDMLFGRYFHETILEPHKAEKWESVEIKNRNTNKYREAKELNNGEDLLLRHEIEFAEKLAHRMLNVEEIFNLVDLQESKKEVPSLGIVLDKGRYVWKGKADIVSEKQNLVIDIKTTANYETFKTSAYKYNYHTQAFIYRELFDKNFIIVGICKKTMKPFIWEPSDIILEQAEEKIIRAEEMFYKYIDPNGAGEDASQHLIKYNF
ncbi:MAG: PD-(D/E)XK nuclease-like domain-containing protein [Bacteroidia bacterium]|nr:PD-(D/E)XK nuclease-like domain-containing protein [Bacteroidia bacterium]